MGVEGLQRLRQFEVFRAERIELGGGLRGVSSAFLSRFTEVVDTVLGERSGREHAHDQRYERDPDRGPVSANGGHETAIVTRMQQFSGSGEENGPMASCGMPLADYRIEPFSHDGITHDVYHRGDGPCVLVAPEIPGITPTVAGFADRLVERGFSVAIASLFGTPGKPSSVPRALATIAKACVSREFHVLATQDSSPATDWLRALARELHTSHGGPGVGFVGMCFTGGFGLAMLLDDTVVAPVLSQPSLPFGFGGARQASTGLSADELQQVVDKGCPVLGLRFTGDSLVPGARFATLKEALGDNFLHEEIPSPSDTPGAETKKAAHSVLTEDLAPDDQPDHPSQMALARTLDFLAERLELAGA